VVRRAAAFAFRGLRVEAVRAAWFHDHPASERVLKKPGFAREVMADRPFLARGRSIPCHLEALDRATYMTRKMAA
jgi:RimJ/RimL family protein N-acetyltransferase